MTHSIVKKLAIAGALVLTGLLFAQFASLPDSTASAADRHFAEKVNLALRRTAHLLLTESGDSTSRIAPVQNAGAGTFLLRLERPFDYSRLPVLLQESFRLHDIQDRYDVAVLDCLDGNLLLGYNAQDVELGTGAACSGRQQSGDCYDLQVSFTQPKSSPVTSFGWWALAGGFLLGGISYAAWQWLAKGKNAGLVPSEPAEESASLVFGNSSLDFANQILTLGAVRQPLTYRETKLLHLFVTHPDQLLERDYILQSVWNDEGIIVGRSVDVFVSRLRKMLRNDPTVRIATVHGVGYRLEVQTS